MIKSIIKKICEITDILAGVCFFSVMALVLSNILLRNILKLPILGTVEIVGLLTATGLGLALVNCEMNDGNIAMDVFTEKLSKKTQKIIEIAVYIISLVFFASVAWWIFLKAINAYGTKWVTSTASIPHYPFIFILGVNLFFLCVVLAYKLVCAFGDASAKFRKPKNEIKEENK